MNLPNFAEAEEHLHQARLEFMRLVADEGSLERVRLIRCLDATEAILSDLADSTQLATWQEGD